MTIASQLTATGTLVVVGARLLGLLVRATGTAGTIVLKDGGAGGVVLLTLDTPAAVGSFYVPIPGGGILFATDVYAILTNADGVTAFHD